VSLHIHVSRGMYAYICMYLCVSVSVCVTMKCFVRQSGDFHKSQLVAKFAINWLYKMMVQLACGVATISRLLKIIGFLCRISSRL